MEWRMYAMLGIQRASLLPSGEEKWGSSRFYFTRRQHIIRTTTSVGRFVSSQRQLYFVTQGAGAFQADRLSDRHYATGSSFAIVPIFAHRAFDASKTATKQHRLHWSFAQLLTEYRYQFSVISLKLLLFSFSFSYSCDFFGYSYSCYFSVSMFVSVR